MFDPDSKCVNRISVAKNFDERSGACGVDGRPDMLILHYTGMPDAQGALDWLCVEESRVSCHYFIFETGEIVQLLPEQKRAWHAGVSCWGGDPDTNSRSIGIEIANPGPDSDSPDFPVEQMRSVGELCLDIVTRNRIDPFRILGHSDVAVGRKIDPGPHFDWEMLSRIGVGRWLTPTEPDSPVFALGDRSKEVFDYQKNLSELGYCLELTGIFDDWTKSVTEAFQLHWRQARVDGQIDASTISILSQLVDIKRENATIKV